MMMMMMMKSFATTSTLWLFLATSSLLPSATQGIDTRCNYDLQQWMGCVKKEPDCAAACEAFMQRDVPLIDCLDIAAQFCEMKSCCPKCSSQNTHTDDWGYEFEGNLLDNYEWCLKSQPLCILPDCDVIQSSDQTCKTQYDAFSDSCDVELPSSLMTGSAAAPNDDGRDSYQSRRSVFFEYRGNSIKSVSYEMDVIEQCAADTKTFQECALANDGVLKTDNINNLDPAFAVCRPSHDLWTRCLQKEDCRDSCSVLADGSCLQYEATICGKRCCCDSCGDLLENYETCIQTAEFANCPVPQLPCSDRFCLSGAVATNNSIFVTNAMMVAVAMVVSSTTMLFGIV